MSTLKTINIIHPSGTTNNIVLDDAGNVSFGGTFNIGSSFKRNRIINGNMLIDQRNAGASVTPVTGVAAFPVDRMQCYLTQSSKFSTQQSITVPTGAGFTNSVVITSSGTYSPVASDYFSFTQRIEGYNVSDLGFGTASAKTITVSFWARSSLTGTWTGALHNNAFNRVYPFTYTINAANTWEYKTVTIAGDTAGTWTTDNSVGLEIGFAFSVGSSGLGTAGAWAGATGIFGATGQTNLLGTNGATFYVTGVQLEVGTKATPYEMQIYSDQLAQCQRYYEIGNFGTQFINLNATGSYFIQAAYFKVPKRVAPTSYTFASMQYYDVAGIAVAFTVNVSGATTNVITAGSGGLSNPVGMVGGSVCAWTASSEL